MRLSYTDLKNDFLDNIGQTGSTDANLLSFFQRRLGARYQLGMAYLDNYLTQIAKSANTAVGQQFYHYPSGIENIKTATVQVGSIYYPLIVVNSQLNWDRLNEVLITTSAIPQFILPRRDDFGIWPTPQGIYPIQLNFNMRDRNLTNEDYITGTVSTLQNSTTVTGSGTTFTQAMVGRWFVATADGYWYRISGYISATNIVLETSFEGLSLNGTAYRIAETPELPEEAHSLLSAGVTADYFSGPRSDIKNATWYNNVFWTGDGQNSDRTGENILGGFVGIQKRYANRSNSVIVRRMGNRSAANTKLWETRISSG